MPKALVKDNVVVDVQDAEFEVHSDFTWHDVGDDVKVGWTLSDGAFSEPAAVTLPWDVARMASYPEIREQLDLLWHAIDDGQFGDSAKSSAFYTTLQTVKNNNPKPE